MLPEKYEPTDKIVALILGEIEATPQLERQLEKIDRAWSLLHNGFSRLRCAQLLKEKYGIENSQAYKLLRDAELVYGNVAESTLKGKKAVYAENFKRLAKQAEKKGDLKTAGNLLAKAARVEGAFDRDVSVMIDPADWTVPVEIEFSSDPEVFRKSQQPEAEDTEYEEVDDAE